VKILVDPGHGGSDPGAINRRFGFAEKDFALDLGKKIVEALVEAAPGAEVRMTREEDRFLSLGERVEISKDFASDVFLSVHHNARPEGSVAWPGFEFESFYRRGLALGSAFRLGAALNRAVLAAVEAHGMRARDRGVKEAGFAVLRASGDAILAEYGFITDDEEALFLLQDEHRSLLAVATAEAVVGYSEWNSIGRDET